MVYAIMAAIAILLIGLAAAAVAVRIAGKYMEDCYNGTGQNHI